MAEGWISIPGWRRFQHYDPARRQPPWIKVYLELLSDDEYLALSEHRALLLHRLWLEYAASRCRLSLGALSTGSRGSLSYKTLSSRLSLRVTRADIESLSDAGFIEIVASRTLAEGYHDASKMLASRAPARSQETEVEEDLLGTDRVDTSPANGLSEDHERGNLGSELEVERLLAFVGEHADNGTRQVVLALARRLPEAALASVLEATKRARPSNRAGYVVEALKSQLVDVVSTQAGQRPARPDVAAVVTANVRQLARSGHEWATVESFLAGAIPESVSSEERASMLELAANVYREAQAEVGT